MNEKKKKRFDYNRAITRNEINNKQLISFSSIKINKLNKDTNAKKKE